MQSELLNATALAAPTSVATRQGLSELSSVLAAPSVLKEKKDETIMSKQLLRCGTSIGANVKEAVCGQTPADFYAKMNISLKETSETEYWLELLHESDYIDQKSFESIYADCKELIRILTSITKTQKQ